MKLISCLAFLLSLSLHGLGLIFICNYRPFLTQPKNDTKTIWVKYIDVKAGPSPQTDFKPNPASFKKNVRKQKIENRYPIEKPTDSNPGNSASTDGPLEISLRREPQLLNPNQRKIPYPKKAQALGIEGQVELLLHISKTGTVLEAKVIDEPGYGFAQAAQTLAQGFIFLPAADEKGQPIESTASHRVIFRLE